MEIKKEHLETYWYEDKDRNRLPCGIEIIEEPKNAEYYVSIDVLTVKETVYKLVRQEEIDECRHPRKYLRREHGLSGGYKRRICDKCGGTQTRKWYQPWGTKWEGRGLRKLFTGSTHIGSTDLIMAMVNSGDYDLQDAMLISARSCERCLNVLERKYLGEGHGYEEYSVDWFMCNTSCNFCRDDDTKPTKEVEEEIKKIKDEIENRYKQRKGSEEGVCNCACETPNKKTEKAFRQGIKITKFEITN